jgi:DNA-binding transcriptional MerR regulator
MTPDLDDPEQVVLTTQEAARAAHVDPAIVRDWARRGLLEPVDPNSTPRRYREIHVLRVERATRRAPRELQLAQEAWQDLHAA